MKHVLVCDPMDEQALNLLNEASQIEVSYRPTISPEELRQALPEYDAVFVRSRTELRRDTLACGTRLEVVGRAGTGLDNIDVAFANEQGIQVLNTPGANANAVAELTVALMLMLARHILPSTASVRSGKPQKMKGVEVQGKTLGLVGFGNIGRLVCKLARGFGMKVLAYDPLVKPEHIPEALRVVRLCPLEDALSQSDVVSLHAPLIEATQQLINAERLALFKPGARLINTARAGLIDEGAVLQALNEGQLAGYATDLPELGAALLEHPHVVVTSHIGAATVESQRRAGEGIVERVLEALDENQ